MTARGDSFDQDDPVMVHLDSVDGPVLATLTPDSGNFEGPVPVPADIKPGNHVLMFIQRDASGAIEEVPLRGLLAVTSSAGGTPLVAVPVAADSSARQAALARSAAPHPVGMGTLVLVALGAAALAMLVAGVVIMVARRANTARVVS